ncbi:hypothetical protein G6O69_19235 [Pseudenhygromyxa sp. WMMC2535]|uniref:hypothetical protein n=1 Tax=Pseudenhygromyxa sp. WMMC2535 TaxID=2712867 RepID=UPI001554EF78|nr:hypothetical protein [Pseudenhygromyxa sp. WMMC2535]NVB39987.1 hypothetical protein [Pseudenhygromyxa sp. WMMC2535]
MRLRSRIPAALAGLLACAPAAQAPDEGSSSSSSNGNGSGSDDASGEADDATSAANSEAGDTADTDTGDTSDDGPIPAACVTGEPAPQSIPELVARIEALPHPVTIPCVLASLPRPLSVVATDSEFSIQPAVGEDNPRLFILGDGLILSVVPAGDGAPLLEFSEWVDSTHTIKGELAFPITETIDPGDPYDLEYQDGLTRCGVCHANEYEVAERPGAHASLALQPVATSLVDVDGLDALLADCDWQAEAARCELLSGLLDHGEVVEGAFPEDLPTIFD